MGVELVNRSADYSIRPVRFFPVVPRGLRYLGIFNDKTSLGRNLAPDQPQAAVVGSPITNKDAALMIGASAYVQTGVPDLAEGTLITLAGVGGVVNGGTFLVSTYGASYETGSSLYLNTDSGTSTAIGNSQRVSNTPLGASVPNDPRVFRALATRFDATRQTTNDLTLGVVASSTVNSARKLAPGNYRIGSSHLPDTTTSSLICLAAIYERYLSDAELAAFYAWLKAFYASRGFAA